MLAHLRICLVVLIACAAVPGVESEAADWAAVDQLVHQVNPARDIDVAAESAFLGNPTATIAQSISDGFWFSLLVFLPFLILPQILLFYAIFAFRDKGDRRPAATWIGNHKLEIVWTAIPVVALIIVSVPMVRLLYEQEAPPVAATSRGDGIMVEVIGKQFFWIYNYPDYGIENLARYDVDLSEFGIEPAKPIQLQETAAFPLEKVTNMTFTSLDVNHNWGVHAFGIRKDCIKDRINWAWFAPERTGFYEGQCYELCGPDHGAMILTAAVLEAEDFQRWVDVQLLREPALRVVSRLNYIKPAGWNELTDDEESEEDVAAAGVTLHEHDDMITEVPQAEKPDAADVPDETQALPADPAPALTPEQELRAAVDAYLADLPAHQRDKRLFALRFWTSYDGAIKAELLRNNGLVDVAADVEEHSQQLRDAIDAALEQVLADVPGTAGGAA